jgi:hypothetical protein
MRIALRPSGGRGDYELAGSDNGVNASDLLEKQFYYQITPSLTIDGKAKAHRLDGKTRIRPQGDGKHPYVVVYSLLLLPPPRRELVKTASTPLTTLTRQQYILYWIDVDLIEKDTGKVVFAPTNVWAKNQGGLLKVDFAERLAVVSTLWAAAVHNKSNLGKMVLKHRNAAIASDHTGIQKAAAEIQKLFNSENDVLPLILNEFNLPGYSNIAYTEITDGTDEYEFEENNTPPQDALRNRIRKWRMQADRGPGARRFSMEVREAYDYRCLFSGERFPKLEQLDSAGVDGAHILPWSTHGLNSIENGLCLCKQCHWGFDNGLLMLDFDEQSNSYLLSIPNNIKSAANKENFDLDHFQKNAGAIDKSRLPKDHALWPSPKFIHELNASLNKTQ